jgi:hypothetical protein
MRYSVRGKVVFGRAAFAGISLARPKKGLRQPIGNFRSRERALLLGSQSKEQARTKRRSGVAALEETKSENKVSFG